MNEFNRGDEGKGLLYRESLLHKLTGWLIFLCPLIFFFVVFAISLTLVSLTQSSNLSSINEASSAISTYVKNNKLAPIQSITVVKSSESCTSGSKEHIFKWPGVNSGCICDDNSVHNTGYCWLTGKSCRVVYAEKERNLHVWNKKAFCVKRFQTNEFQIVANKVCKDGFKLCQDYLCVANSLECPISEISETSVTGASKLEFDGKTFYLTKEKTKNHVTFIKAEFNNFPCLAGGKHPVGTDYPLLKERNKGCGSYGDQKIWSSQLQTETVNTFYDENDMKTVLSRLPFYNNFEVAEDKMTLNKIGWINVKNDAICLNFHNNFDTISGTSYNLVTTFYRYSSVILLLSTLGLFFSFGYIFLKNLRFNKRYPFGSNALPYYLTIVGAFVILFCIIQAGYYWNQVSELNLGESEGDYLEKVLDKKCFNQEKELIKAIQVIRSHFTGGDQDLYGLVIFLFSWSVFWLVIWIVCFLIRRFQLNVSTFMKPTH